jgi:predicted permease
MSQWSDQLRSKLAGLQLDPAHEAEIIQELEQHLDDRYAELRTRGESEDAAREGALREIESCEVLRRELRLSRPTAESRAVFGKNGGQMFSNLGQDMKLAVRLMMKRPWFSIAIVLTLGVCIGSVGAVFSAVDAAMFRALPFPEPDRLTQIVIWYVSGGQPYINVGQDGVAWEALKSAQSIDLAVYSGGMNGVNFTSGDRATYIHQQRISAGYFRVGGVPPILGREFTDDEDREGGPTLAILSYEFWRSSFNSNPNVVGQLAQIAGQPYAIVGVAAPGFESKFGTADVWTPLHPSTKGEGQGTNYEIVGRVKPGVSWAQADTEIQSLGQGLFRQRGYRPETHPRFGLTTFQNSMSDGLRTPLLLILSGTILVLIIGCVNVAAMLLARGVARRGEIAIRMALGASRSTVIRQLMIENLGFGLAASVVGIAVSYAGVVVLRSQDIGWEILKAARLDWRTLVATMIISLAATVLFGLIPALNAGDIDLRSADVGRGVVGGARSLLCRALPVLQVAIAVFLLIGAGLLLRSFGHLWTLTPGFDSSNVVSAGFSLGDARYRQGAATTRLINETIRRLHEISGIESAAVALSLPYERGMNTVFNKPSDARNTPARLTNVIYVSPEFFDAFRIPLLRGRRFTDSDSDTSPQIAVVNEAFVKLYYRTEDPIGNSIRFFGNVNKEIVGVVGDTQQKAGWGRFGPMGSVPSVYLPTSQLSFSMPGLPKWIVRTQGANIDLRRQIENAVKLVDPLLPMATFQTVDEIKRAAFSWQEFLATSMGFAAVLALLLSIIGTYAMISNSVAERTKEFGIRMALGATVAQTIHSAARPGMICAAVGLFAGIIAARFETKLLDGLIWGVKTTDLTTFISIPFGVLIIAAFASIVPALRISRLDPAQTLRQE